MEKCESTKVMRKKLNVAKEREHMILWRKITKNLKELYRKANLKIWSRGKALPTVRPHKEEGHLGSGRNRTEPASIH